MAKDRIRQYPPIFWDLNTFDDKVFEAANVAL